MFDPGFDPADDTPSDTFIFTSRPSASRNFAITNVEGDKERTNKRLRRDVARLLQFIHCVTKLRLNDRSVGAV